MGGWPGNPSTKKTSLRQEHLNRFAVIYMRISKASNIYKNWHLWSYLFHRLLFDCSALCICYSGIFKTVSTYLVGGKSSANGDDHYEHRQSQSNLLSHSLWRWKNRTRTVKGTFRSRRTIRTLLWISGAKCIAFRRLQGHWALASAPNRLLDRCQQPAQHNMCPIPSLVVVAVLAPSEYGVPRS